MNIKQFSVAAVLVGLLCTASLQAALPPLYQNKREIETILNSKELAKIIPEGESLQEIKKIPEGYLIITTNLVVPVQVHYIHTHKEVGPAKFTIEFGEPIPICGCQSSGY